MTPAKKTPQLPRSPLTNRTMKIGFRTLDELYGDPHDVNVRALDPLAEMEREEDRDAVQELRKLRAERRRVEFRRKIEAEKQKLGAVDVAGGGLGIKGLYNFSPQEMQQISQMPEKEKEDFFGTLQRLSTMAAMSPQGGVAGQGMNPMFQLMAMGGFNPRGQQGLGLRDITEIGKMYETIYKGAGGGDKSLTDTLLMKLMTETVPGLQAQANQNLQMAYQAQIVQLQANQSDPMRDLEYAKNMAGMMGYAPQAQSADVAMATLKMQDGWKQKEWEFKMKELGDRKMIGMVKEIMKNADIPGMVRAATRQQTRDLFNPQPAVPSAEAVLPQPGTTQQGPAQNQMGMKAPMNGMGPPMGDAGVKMMEYTCTGCKAQMVAPAGVPSVTCQSCGKVHQTTYAQE